MILLKKEFDAQLSKKQIIFAIIVLIPGFLYIFPEITKFILLTSLKNGWIGPKYVNLILNLTVDVICLSLIFIIYHDFIKKSFIQLKLNWKNYLRFNLTFGLLIYFLMNLCVGIIISALLGGKDVNPGNQDTVEALLQLHPLFMILSSTIVAPFIEEFIFRGCVFTPLYKNHKILAFVISASVFGFMHTLPYMSSNFYREAVLSLSYISSGLYFCLIYAKHKNIFSSVMMHGIVNSIAVVMLFFV